ncbi:MarR family winged helix-turn-helix transcriptional regulator [Parabacteroides sp. PF5-6]|uniref:MarR family winged helix-turn-helix transcriptional regulator n=1 Tax=Parabacteroides sp. PF5-6 TaxID=1742403 RepID=UPI002404DAF9|nr:MarR family winged helix-turn-helix transcriptional regulator [Parabacteroides sp. PF5-6]MDF9830313.1 DNA-binding MarR family transcriptional regulator [Parabacteroides sp. PF5-6]
MKKKIDKPDEQLGYLLTQVSFLKQRIINATLKELDITYIQFIILAGTLELSIDEIVTQQLISDKRRLDKAMVSNVVKTLIEKGLMMRHTHPVDKRAYTLSLTEAGVEKAIRGKELALKIDRTFFSGIDKEKFLESLQILINNNPNSDE